MKNTIFYNGLSLMRLYINIVFFCLNIIKKVSYRGSLYNIYGETYSRLKNIFGGFL